MTHNRVGIKAPRSWEGNGEASRTWKGRGAEEATPACCVNTLTSSAVDQGEKAYLRPGSSKRREPEAGKLHSGHGCFRSY